MARFWNSRFVLAGLVLALLLALTESERVAARDSKRHSEPVTVVNTAANPVPIKAVGTTPVTGSVTIGRDSKVQAQQSGPWNVGITNNSLPVTGSVSVSNLPLDSAGNVRTSLAQGPTKFEYETVLATECNVPTGIDLCAVGGTFTGPVKDVLTNLSSQGFDLFAVTPLDPGSQGADVKVIVYTLRRPVVV